MDLDVALRDPWRTAERIAVAPSTRPATFEMSAGGAERSGRRTNDSPMRRLITDQLDSGGPSIVYQPVVHIESRRQLGVEALARFDDARFDTREWFELAGRVGMRVALEIGAARNALATLDGRARRRLGWEIIGINVSPDTLLDPQFDEALGEHLGNHVVIEVSAAGEQTDWVDVRRYVDRARDLDVRIAVNALTCDPNVELERLLEIEPEIVKLDTSYTSALVDSERRRGAAEDFLRGCMYHGVFVVAVGVEHEDHLHVLAELGVDAAQGYLFGRPQPAPQFETVSISTLGRSDLGLWS
jgi:EAL domain-containing protein (putative c-di-GMP-specific phosphodiesterase class I)